MDGRDHGEDSRNAIRRVESLARRVEEQVAIQLGPHGYAKDLRCHVSGKAV